MEDRADRKLLPTPFRWSWKILLTAALVVGPGVFGADGAAAREIECDPMIERAVTTGETYRVTIDVERQSVRIEGARGDFCYESIPTWTARKLPMAGGEGKQPDTPPPGALAPQASDGEDQAARRLPPAKPPCDRQLARFWEQGTYEIRGQHLWLERVYTLDLDGDGWTDDVGFRFKSGDEEFLVLRYFGTPDTLAAREVEFLKLADDGVVPRLCFDQLSFVVPTGGSEKPQIVIDVPNLAEELARKTSGGGGGDTEEEMEEKAETASSGGWGWFGFGAGLAVVIGAGIGGFLTRHRWLPSKRDDDDDDDDDYDDDED